MPATEIHDPTQTRRLEMILRQVDALPTLPMVATRLLALTSSEDSDAKEVITLISSDQALTAKVLSMVRAANRGVRDVTTVDRAVVLLGFEAIRNAVLSVKVIELFEKAPAGAPSRQGGAIGARTTATTTATTAATATTTAQNTRAPSAPPYRDGAPDEPGEDILPAQFCFDHVAFWR
ncbi:MAG: HDOD domain-containing protein, partial [Phycisphaeraceae bacterium]